MAGNLLKNNFAVKSQHGAFYTGGKVQVSGSGEFIICQCGTQVKALDVKTGETAHTIGQDDDVDVTSFTLSPDDVSLMVAYRNLILRQWDWKAGKVTRTWKAIHTAPVSCMAMDITSTLLATGGADSTIKVWDAVQQYCTHNLRGHQGVISVVAFHPDISKLLLVTAANDYMLRIWQLETSSCLAILESHYSVITAVTFSADGSQLYSGGRDKVLIVWDMEKRTKKTTIPVYECVEGMALLPARDTGYTDLCVTESHQHLITVGSKGALHVWDVDRGKCVFMRQCIKQPEDEESPALLSISLHDNTVTVVTCDHNIMQYTLDNLELLRQFSGYNDDILDARLFGGDESLLAVATNSELLKVFNMDTWACQIVPGHSSTIMCVDVSADGQLLVTGSKDRSVRVWRLEEGRLVCVAVANGHTNSVLTAAFSRLHLSYLVTASEDLTLKLWPLPPKYETSEVVTLHARVTEKAHDKDINSVTVSPNDKLLATGSQDRTAKLWRASDLSLLGVFRGHKRGIWNVVFSPVDQCVATASADTTIKIWALSDFSCVKTFEGHEGSVLRVSFLARGMQLLSSGSDGLLKLWTLKDNVCVKTLDAHEEKVWALTVSKSEQCVVTGAGDSNIVIWKDVTEEEMRVARAQQEDLLLKPSHLNDCFREQTLSNLIQQKSFLKAISLAITLDQPARLLSIFREILGTNGRETKELEETLSKLRDDQIDSVLHYVSHWNMNSRSCHEAHTVLQMILTSVPPETLLSLPQARTSIETLLPYTERHMQRMNRLLEAAMFVEYTWQNIRLPQDTSSEMETEQQAVPLTSPETTSDKENKADRMETDECDMAEVSPTKRRKSGAKSAKKQRKSITA